MADPDLDRCAELIFTYAKDTLGLRPAHSIYALAVALGTAMGSTNSPKSDDECFKIIREGIEIAIAEARASLPESPEAT